MKRLEVWIAIVLIGTVWGLAELMFGAALPWKFGGYSAILMGALALFLLAILRGAVNIPGGALVAGLVAAGFRLASAGVHVCHVAAVVLLALVFDAVATAMLRGEAPDRWRIAIAGPVTALLSFAVFALSMTYIVQLGVWTAGGWPRILDYVFFQGALTGLAALVLMPVGWQLGRWSRERVHEPRLLLRLGGMATIAVLWIAGQWLGA